MMITRIVTCHYRVRTRSKRFYERGNKKRNLWWAYDVCASSGVHKRYCTLQPHPLPPNDHFYVVKIRKLSQFHAILMGRMMCIVCATRVAEGTTKRIGRFPTHHCFPVYRYLLLGVFSFVGSWKQFHIASPKNPMLYLKAQNHQFICGCNGFHLPRLP